MSKLVSFLPSLVVVALAAAACWALARVVAARARERGAEPGFAIQLAIPIIAATALAIAIVLLPVGETLRGQLLGLIGLAITAVIALSSTTFVSNALAGVMLRTVRNFRPGDFIRVGEHFGRVTARALLHTEIQTEDRDLLTLPNIYLVTNPVTVVRESGTLVSCVVALGYDNAHDVVEKLLLEAAERAGLGDAFVQVRELDNFTVRYRVAGFLADVSRLLSTRSSLRTAILDTLHGAGIEIASPTLMTQRRIERDEKIIPPVAVAKETPTVASARAPEDIMFDKAERAAEVEGLRKKRETLLAQVEQEKKRLDEASKTERAAIEAAIARLEQRAEELAEAIAAAEKAATRDGND